MNEDAHYLAPLMCIVADGMGGHGSGDVASTIAIEVLAGDVPPTGWHDTAALLTAVDHANAAIRSHAIATGTHGMGTTLVAAAVIGTPGGGQQVAVVHVGDSRCYRLCDGTLALVTSDHSLVQELVGAGRLERDAMAKHPMANVVTRALGADASVAPDIAVLDHSPARLLLCSDGLWGELTAQVIGRVLAGITDPQAAAERLLAIALKGPARDNITAVVADIGGGLP